jgi:hypothetical protein
MELAALKRFAKDLVQMQQTAIATLFFVDLYIHAPPSSKHTFQEVCKFTKVMEEALQRQPLSS